MYTPWVRGQTMTCSKSLFRTEQQTIFDTSLRNFITASSKNTFHLLSLALCEDFKFIYLSILEDHRICEYLTLSLWRSAIDRASLTLIFQILRLHSGQRSWIIVDIFPLCTKMIIYWPNWLTIHPLPVLFISCRLYRPRQRGVRRCRCQMRGSRKITTITRTTVFKAWTVV